MKIHEIRELIRLIDESTIDKFVYEKDGEKIKIQKTLYSNSNSPDEVQFIERVEAQVEKPTTMVKQEEVVEAKEIETTPAVVDTSELFTITSPMVGTFYSKPSPEEEDFVSVGSRVQEKSVVCIVEAMKLFNEIEADVKGEIVEILVYNGQLVEYGQPLFLVREE